MDRSAIDRLYALPLVEFTAGRDALAKAARRDGDRDLAAQIKGLTKPAVPAWALNQLARRDPKRFGRWIASVDDLRAAQIGLLSGSSDAGAVREAQRAERDAMVQLREAVGRLLGAGEHKPNIAILERAVRTFRGAAMDGDARASLIEGRLSAEHDEPGFDALVAGYSSARSGSSPARAAKVSPSIVIAERPKEVQRAAAEAKKREAALRERLRAARDERTAARAEAHRAAKAAEKAEQAADEAVAQATKARADASEAARAQTRAEEKVAALEREIP